MKNMKNYEKLINHFLDALYTQMTKIILKMTLNLRFGKFEKKTFAEQFHFQIFKASNFSR